MARGSLPPMHDRLHCFSHLILPAADFSLQVLGHNLFQMLILQQTRPRSVLQRPQDFSSSVTGLLQNLLQMSNFKIKPSSYIFGLGWCPLQPAGILLFLIVVFRVSVCFPLHPPNPLFKVATNSLSLDWVWRVLGCLSFF